MMDFYNELVILISYLLYKIFKKKEIIGFFIKIIFDKKDNITELLKPLAFNNNIEDIKLYLNQYINNDLRFNNKLYEILKNAEKYHEASKILDYLIEKYSNDRDVLLHSLKEKADLLYFIEDYKNELSLRKRICSIDNSNQSKYNLAESYLMNDQFDKSSKLYLELIKEEYYNPDVFGGLIECYIKTEKYDILNEFYNNYKNDILKYNNDSLINYHVGNILCNQENYLEALSYYKKSQKLDYDDEVNLNIADCYFGLKDYNKTIKHYEKYLNLINDDVNIDFDIYENLSKSYKKLGNLKLAKYYLDLANKNS